MTAPAPAPAQAAPDRALVSAVITLILTRLVVNMTRRFGYPFVGAIAASLAVPLLSVQNVLSLQVGLGVSSPLFGGLSDRYGRKRVIMVLLALMTLAALAGALLPTFGVFAVVMLIFGFGKMLIDPSVLAYVGDRVPYHRRGMAVAATELGWAGALLVAAPLVGFLLETSTLSAVFAVFAALLALMAGVVWWRIPDDAPARGAGDLRARPRPSWGRLVAFARAHPRALPALLFPLCISVANELFFINYSSFMNVSFGLQLTALGVVTVVISAAEIGGELSVMGLADRFGKRRIALVGTLVSSAAYLALPALNSSLPLALAGIFVMFLFVEVGIVAALSIFTELVPEARSTVMGGVVGMASLGRLVGGAAGGLLYALTNSFAAVGLAAGAVGLIAALVMALFVRESATAGAPPSADLL